MIICEKQVQLIKKGLKLLTLKMITWFIPIILLTLFRRVLACLMWIVERLEMLMAPILILWETSCHRCLNYHSSIWAFTQVKIKLSLRKKIIILNKTHRLNGKIECEETGDDKINIKTNEYLICITSSWVNIGIFSLSIASVQMNLRNRASIWVTTPNSILRNFLASLAG